MKSFVKYGTGIVFNPKLAKAIVNLGIPYCLRIETRDDPSRKFWFKEDGRSTLNRIKIIPGVNDSDEQERMFGHHQGKELIVCARKESDVTNFLSLVGMGYTLVDTSPNYFPYDGIYELTKKQEIYQEFSHYENMVFAVTFANRCWGDIDLVFASEKLRASYETWSTTHNANHPKEGDFLNQYYWDYTYGKVQMALAIGMAYSSLEQLDLVIKSSPKTHRFIKKGVWNPVVYDEIKSKLAKIDISEEVTIDWILRGSKSLLEYEVDKGFGRLSEWTAYPGVRDIQLTIIQALDRLSWLRNEYLTHKFRKDTRLITPYDVHSSQMLARFLLLKRLNLWKYNFQLLKQYGVQ